MTAYRKPEESKAVHPELPLTDIKAESTFPRARWSSSEKPSNVVSYTSTSIWIWQWSLRPQVAGSLRARTRVRSARSCETKTKSICRLAPAGPFAWVW